MGQLKDMLERAMREARNLDNLTTDAEKLFKKYEATFQGLLGKPLIWKTSNNPIIKNPQLVTVEKPYRHFVVVSKIVYNVDGHFSVLRYAINYSALIAGQDSVELLERKRR